ncbi:MULTISPECIES: type VI secretion system lipoprotein TssJ [unclassified Agarivorans]|uniref:type VI secretion system lipoprotein TssJ n=1 Tax=unclassified Agarivorans TaxID=2636026 RepID=UPI0010CFB53D|nr:MULTISPECIES: type VI secretion system lipoprotein TssJ [unclassified Agarivorans]MDO6685508.1 type VI secretion system lipoprotein TssJ [Agarivorans sp. 3_MG-2023]MDO6715894.1 type VI secretion system lipoprotein TssJ [Agarivorans sp. 2_MG-2023]MDO6764937.1 type VI secretion system lipoprotein TssJ [Agarivorans sp. 1_MG-2023]GDY25317.1 type VI secretion lipoprotein [Agarivorans sp. Toyoura001]
MSNIGKLVLSVLLSVSMFGCTVANYVVEPYSKLQFHVDEGVNPDITGRASPVVVKVFELSSRTLFDSQDFFALYDDASQVLGPDLINRTEFEFEPGSQFEYKLSLSPGVRYAGVLVAYRDIDTASWREVVTIDPTNYKTFDVHVGELAVFVGNP